MPSCGPESFAGTWIGASRAGATFVGEAYFDGLVVPTVWSREAAAEVLPAGWHLATNVSAERDAHPIVFMLGRQHRTAIMFGGATLPIPADYDEVMIAVPFVRHEASRLLHTFVPRMYAGDPWAIWSGNAYFGFAKRHGTIERFTSTLAVTDEAGMLLMHATVFESGTWRPASAPQCQEHVIGLSHLSCLPIVGRREDGRDIESYFDWNFDRAYLRPISASLQLDSRLGPGLIPTDRIESSDDGVEVRGLRWRLSWPQACHT
jgi:hypothetical protein